MFSRWFRFILAILVGIAAGLLYAWVINPVKVVNTTPDSLSQDYKTDYVLMVAEAYHTEGDLSMATQRLLLLGSSAPADTTQQAIQSAAQHNYRDVDLAQMRALLQALQGGSSSAGTPAVSETPAVGIPAVSETPAVGTLAP